MHRDGGQGDVAEHRGQVDVLERAAAQHLRGHLPGDREHRRPVETRVVEAGEQVRRARPGDREARRRAPGELAVRRGRERRRALVPDPDVADLAAPLGLAQRVGEPEVGVPDHAEHGVDAPRHQRLHQHVGDAARAFDNIGQRHVGAVGALLDRERDRRVAEPLRRPAGRRVVVVAVPRTAQQPVLDRALAQRAALVGTVVVQRADPPAAAGDRHAATVDDRGMHATLVGDGVDAVPAGRRPTGRHRAPTPA